MTSTTVTDEQLAKLDPEQLPVPKHRLRGNGYFAGLYATEHVAATEFVFGATFVAMGAGIWDILIGLIIGNTLAVLSFWLITTPIARQARLSLYTYLQKVAGDSFSRIYNLANAVIFSVIAAAMITVSATAVRRIFSIPPQTEAYPTHIGFIIIAVAFSCLAVVVAVFGFEALAKIAGIVGPWLMALFLAGGMVLLPVVTESITGSTQLTGFNDFIGVAGSSVFTGINSEGEPGIGLIEVAGFAWAANTFAHFGLIDMALLRYAKKSTAGLATSTGMMFGHYVAWIAAGFMGAATAAITQTSIAVLEPGDVAWVALGVTGFVIVIIAGWTTANANLYRAGLAAQAVFPNHSRTKVTLLAGIAVVIAACFPVVYRNMLPLLTYAGLILVPIGGIIFAEHHLFKRIGYARFWMKFSGVRHNIPALITWPVSLAIAVGLNALQLMPYYYLFVPTWLISIGLYTFIAGRMGAKRSYPDGEAEEAAYQEKVAAFQAKQAEKESSPVPDRSVLSRGIMAVWIASLLVIVALAWQVLFHSPDLYVYYVNLDRFYLWTAICTGVYFVFTYWGLRRREALAKRVTAERPGAPVDTTARRTGG